MQQPNDRFSLKICVGYHKPSFLLEGDCFVPVWGGKAVAGEISKDGAGLSAEERQWMETHCVGDDTGDNISARNRNYCEASVLYWMWKNYDKLGNPDFIGYLQYRAHWVCKQEYVDTHHVNAFYNMIGNQVFTDDYQHKLGLTESSLYEVLNSADTVVCESDMGKRVYVYKQGHFSQDIKWWDMAREIVLRDWPQYTEYFKSYDEGTKYVWKNCFIMRREDFLEYCPFLFDVLAKIDAFAQEDYKGMTAEQMRVPAYVSETLLGVFIAYLRAKSRVIKNIPLVSVEKPFETPFLLPRHVTKTKKEAIPIVFIADERYLKYTSVAITSLRQHAAADKHYDVIILEDGKVSPEMKERLCRMGTENISVRFFNASYYINKYRFSSFFHRRLNVMPYLKLFIHEILADYDKAIFLDGDVLVLQDIAQLYEVSLEGYLIAAVQDCIETKVQNDFWDFRRRYVMDNNKLDDMEHYCNSGVLVMDLKAMRQEPELLNQFICEARFQHKDRFHHDQDVINTVLEHKIKQLPCAYNFQACVLRKYFWERIPASTQLEMKTVLNNQQIIALHCDGDPKPWQPHRVKNWISDLWWKYARLSPFYEEFICQNIRSTSVTGPLLRDALHLTRIRCKYWKYRLLMNVVFGRTRQRYKQKKHEYKRRIEIVKAYLRGR